jgi:hypothetical protein
VHCRNAPAAVPAPSQSTIWIKWLRTCGTSESKRVEEMKSDRARLIMIKDPAGNSLAFAQTLDRSMAR